MDVQGKKRIGSAFNETVFAADRQIRAGFNFKHDLKVIRSLDGVAVQIQHGSACGADGGR